jgi:predicted secreted hydrolase
VIGALAVLAAALAAVAAAAGPRVTLPRDHYAHAAGIEWWYVTGLARGQDGHRYSVFYTLFKRGGLVLPVSQVVDLSSGALVGHTEAIGRATLGARSLDVATAGATLRYAGETDTWTFGARGPGYSLALVARPEKPYVLHGGGTGYIAQSQAGLSAYYSATRMAATGSIVHGGRKIPFVGTAWLDHQWGNFVDDPRAFNWDWFSCRFDDRTELMLYRFRTRAGRPLAANRNGTFVRRDGSGRQVTAFSVVPGARVLDEAGHRWPLDWTLHVPALGLTETVHSLSRNQLVRNAVLPTFWEGASSATGTKRGYCFVEETYR